MFRNTYSNIIYNCQDMEETCVHPQKNGQRCGFSQDICPGVGFLDHMIALFLVFKEPLYCSPREGNGTPLQYSCLENLMDGGAWWAAVHGVTRSWTRLRDFILFFYFHALKEEKATLPLQCSCLENPRDGEPGGLLSMGSHRVGHD